MSNYNGQILYVLVSSEKDYYYEEAYLSALTAKKHNPDFKITFLVDNITKDNMTGFRSKIMKYVDEVIVHDFKDDISMYDRSRYLKTNMRFLVKGDFIYVDVDTILAGDISDIFNTDADIAAVYDRHVRLEYNGDKRVILKALKDMGYHDPIDGEYFNSGVLLVKDNEKTAELFKNWDHYYNYERKHSRYKKDQFALSEANYKMGGIIKPISGVFNCQMDRGVKYLSDARVIHYLGLLDYEHPKSLDFDYLMFELANVKHFREFRIKEELTDDILNIIENPHAAIRDILTVPIDSTVYHLINSNHFLVQMIIYNRVKWLYQFNERVLAGVKRMIGR